jgi:hypothetical protein
MNRVLTATTQKGVGIFKKNFIAFGQRMAERWRWSS